MQALSLPLIRKVTHLRLGKLLRCPHMKTTRMRRQWKESRSADFLRNGEASCGLHRVVVGVRRNRKRKTLARSFIIFFVIPSLTLYTFSLLIHTFMSLSQNIIPFLNVRTRASTSTNATSNSSKYKSLHLNSSMAKLICRHFPITRRRSNPSFLTPEEKWDGDREDHERDNCTYNMQVPQAHLIDPRCEHKEYNNREDVSHKNHPD